MVNIEFSHTLGRVRLFTPMKFMPNEWLLCAQKRNPVTRMSSTLAVSDLPWTRRELVAVLSELNVAEAADRTQALPVVLALGESADEECRDIAASWEPLLECDDFSSCTERFQEMTARPQDRITKVWHRCVMPLLAARASCS